MAKLMRTRKSNCALIFHILFFHIVYAAYRKRKVEGEGEKTRMRRSVRAPIGRIREQFDMIESYITHDIHNAFKRRPVKTALVKVAC